MVKQKKSQLSINFWNGATSTIHWPVLVKTCQRAAASSTWSAMDVETMLEILLTYLYQLHNLTISLWYLLKPRIAGILDGVIPVKAIIIQRVAFKTSSPKKFSTEYPCLWTQSTSTSLTSKMTQIETLTSLTRFWHSMMTNKKLQTLTQRLPYSEEKEIIIMALKKTSSWLLNKKQISSQEWWVSCWENHKVHLLNVFKVILKCKVWSKKRSELLELEAKKNSFKEWN